MKTRTAITQGYTIIAFSEKPAADILGAVKANGFRWRPGDQRWERRTRQGDADFLAWLDRKLNPGRPDGACWNCQQPGRFRRFGAATPVLCDWCFAIEREARDGKVGAQ